MVEKHEPKSLNEIARDVISATLERGELRKQEVLNTWEINDETYRELQELVLRHDRIEKGPKGKGAGGFVVRKTREHFPDESKTQRILLQHEWERITVARLAELLHHADLEELLGTLKDALRQSRKARTGDDRRGTKTELATGLVIQHGIDLFAKPSIRKLVAKKCRVTCPGSWHPGKKAAINFVRDTGFPEELTGTPSSERLPDYEYLEGRFELKPLQDFQFEVSRKLLNTLWSSSDRGIVTLPTGAGKTRVAVEAIRDYLSSAWVNSPTANNASVILWLAHTEELCEQAYKCFKQVWESSHDICPLLLIRFWGRYAKNLVDFVDERQWILKRPSILISTPHRIVASLTNEVQDKDEKGFLQDLRKTLGILVIDEAHRAAAPSYRKILSGMLVEGHNVPVVGLTATPFRTEYIADDPDKGTKELQTIFQKLIEPSDTLGNNVRATLTSRGILSEPRFETISTPTAMTIPELPDQLSDADIASLDAKLAVKADNSARRMAILEKLLPIARDEQNMILYFGPSVRDAECMAFLLRQENIPASALSGTTRDVTRRQLIKSFRSREIRVLCNCEVLTTGFDAPKVTHVVMARPTVSRVLYEQIIGRGLRGQLFGGTDVCTILDCEDNYRENRPPLGYESFRSIWESEMASSPELVANL